MKFFLEYTKKEERIKEVKCFIFNKILHFCLINIKKIHNVFPTLNPLYQSSPNAVSKDRLSSP